MTAPRESTAGLKTVPRESTAGLKTVLRESTAGLKTVPRESTAGLKTVPREFATPEKNIRGKLGDCARRSRGSSLATTTWSDLLHRVVAAAETLCVVSLDAGTSERKISH